MTHDKMAHDKIQFVNNCPNCPEIVAKLGYNRGQAILDKNIASEYQQDSRRALAWQDVRYS
jgi:hypothetical protein